MFYAAPIPDNLFFPLGVIFGIIGVFCAGWLIFYVENSRELPTRDRVLGIFFRLILMSIFLGFGAFAITRIQLI